MNKIHELWPYILSASIAIAAITKTVFDWFKIRETQLKIKESQLKIEEMKKAEKREDSVIQVATLEEIEKYGKTIVKRSQNLFRTLFLVAGCSLALSVAVLIGNVPIARWKPEFAKYPLFVQPICGLPEMNIWKPRSLVDDFRLHFRPQVHVIYGPEPVEVLSLHTSGERRLLVKFKSEHTPWPLGVEYYFAHTLDEGTCLFPFYVGTGYIIEESHQFSNHRLWELSLPTTNDLARP